jgi:hypothetical protein
MGSHLSGWYRGYLQFIPQNCLFKIYKMKTAVTGRTFACKPNDVLRKDTTISF